MNSPLQSPKKSARTATAVMCAMLLVPGDLVLLGQESSTTPSGQASTTPPAAKIPAEQLDSLVAPIALYPDPLLAQTLAASTYPLEIVQLYQWLEKNKKLKDKELADAVAKQPWDPSVQGMAGLPDVVKRLADDIQWTTDLGNAFLAQQSDVMDAVQRMRKKAQEKGNLKSTEQVKVETKTVESKTVVVVEQANPQVVYVPSYDPVVVYGAPYYPYPPIYYPPAGYYAAGMAVSFGVGVAMGAMWSGGWGYGCGWGGNDVDINVDNNFNRNTNRNTNIQGGNRSNVSGNRGGGNKWQHNSAHRGAAPYGDRATANRYGGSARGDSLSSRQSSARSQVGRQGGNLPSSRSVSDYSLGSGGFENRSGSAGDRAGSFDRGSGGADRASGSGGADRAGSRDVSRGSSGSGSGFGGGGSYSGSSARASSSRGSSSFGGSRGGSRGGGGRRR